MAFAGYLIKGFYFEITVTSHVLTGNNTEEARVPFAIPLHPPRVTTGRGMVQYHGWALVLIQSIKADQHRLLWVAIPWSHLVTPGSH